MLWLFGNRPRRLGINGGSYYVTWGHFTHESESPWPFHFKLSHWWKRRSQLRDQRSMWMRDGCEVYINSYMGSNGSCFMVTQSIFTNHLFGGRLDTKNRETMAYWTLANVDLLTLYVGHRLCIDFSASRANFLTTLRSHVDNTCSCYFWRSWLNVNVNYSYI